MKPCLYCHHYHGWQTLCFAQIEVQKLEDLFALPAA